MAGGYYITDGVSNCQALGTNAATSLSSTVTTGAANTKGSYSQVTASTATDSAWLMINSNDTFAGTSCSMDVAIGAPGSENIVLADWKNSVNTPGCAVNCPLFPVSIPAGSQVSVRAQSTSAADAIPYSLYLFDDGAVARCGGIIDAVGFTSSTTLGIAVDPGLTTNTKGVYSQIIASTAVDYQGFCFHCDNQSIAYASAVHVLLDLAIGAAGSEKIIIPNYYLKSITGGLVQPAYSPWIDMPIRAGTRVAVRAQADAAAAERVFGFTLYGLR